MSWNMTLYKMYGRLAEGCGNSQINTLPVMHIQNKLLDSISTQSWEPKNAKKYYSWFAA